jgi:hypothetical protein
MTLIRKLLGNPRAYGGSPIMLLQPDEFSDVALGKMKGHHISQLASLGTSTHNSHF